MNCVFYTVLFFCGSVLGSGRNGRRDILADTFIMNRINGVLGKKLRDLSQGVSLPELSLAKDSELVYTKNGARRVYAEPNWIQGPHWVIGTFKDFEGFELKYRINCDVPNGVHPLLRDYVFRRQLENTRTVQRVRYITASRFVGEQLVLNNSRKTAFRMSQSLRQSCMKNGGSSLRYLVSAAANDNLLDRVNRYYESGNPLGFMIGIGLLKMMVLQLGAIHSRGIIHGNVHPSNVVRLAEDDRLVFTNFDFAFFDDEMHDNPPAPPGDPCFDSHWRMTGKTRGYRDDLMSVILIAAYVMHGPAYLKLCNSLNAEELTMFKSEGRLFSLPNSDDIDAPWTRDEFSPLTGPGMHGLHWEKATLIDDHLSRIIRRVRCLVLPESFPDYEAIIDHLNAIQSIIRQ